MEGEVDDLALATRLLPRIVIEALRSSSASLIADGAALRWRGSVLIVTLASAHEPPSVLEQIVNAVTAVNGSVLDARESAVWCFWDAHEESEHGVARRVADVALRLAADVAAVGTSSITCTVTSGALDCHLLADFCCFAGRALVAALQHHQHLAALRSPHFRNVVFVGKSTETLLADAVLCSTVPPTLPAPPQLLERFVVLESILHASSPTRSVSTGSLLSFSGARQRSRDSSVETPVGGQVGGGGQGGGGGGGRRRSRDTSETHMFSLTATARHLWRGGTERMQRDGEPRLATFAAFHVPDMALWNAAASDPVRTRFNDAMRALRPLMVEHRAQLFDVFADVGGVTIVLAFGLVTVATSSLDVLGLRACMLGAAALHELQRAVGSSVGCGVATSRVLLRCVGNSTRCAFVVSSWTDPAAGRLTATSGRAADAASQSAYVAAVSIARLAAVPAEREALGDGGGAILCDQATVELVQSARFPHVAVLLTPVEPVDGRVLFGVEMFHALNEWRAPSLIGRARELSAVKSSLDVACLAGTSSVICIEGEAGIGKSALLYHVMHSMNRADMSVCMSRCAELTSTQPYAVWRAVLKHLYGSDKQTAGARIAHALAHSPRLLAAMPLLEAVLPLGVAPTPYTTRMEPRMSNALLKECLQHLLIDDKHQPMLLMFDDAQWMDSFSWELLLLCVAMANSPIVFLLAFRGAPHNSFGGQGDAQLVLQDRLDALRVACRGNTLSEIDFRFVALRPLSNDNLCELVAQRLHVSRATNAAELNTVAQFLQTEIGGNPFLAEEMIQYLNQKGVLDVRDADADDEPAAAALSSRLARFSSPSRTTSASADSGTGGGGGGGGVRRGDSGGARSWSNEQVQVASSLPNYGASNALALSTFKRSMSSGAFSDLSQWNELSSSVGNSTSPAPPVPQSAPANRRLVISHLTDGRLSLPLTITMEAAIRSRIEKLSPSQAELLNYAAVIGQQFPVAAILAVAVSSSRRQQVIKDVTHLVDEGLLRIVSEESGALRLRFHHQLMQETLYLLLSPDQRRSTHVKVARWYERHCAEELAATAFHFERAQQPALAITYRLAAADHAADHGALRESIVHHGRLLELSAVVDVPIVLKAEWYFEIGAALYAEGELNAALEHLLSALRLLDLPAPSPSLSTVTNLASTAIRTWWSSGSAPTIKSDAADHERSIDDIVRALGNSRNAAPAAAAAAAAPAAPPAVAAASALAAPPAAPVAVTATATTTTTAAAVAAAATVATVPQEPTSAMLLDRLESLRDIDVLDVSAARSFAPLELRTPLLLLQSRIYSMLALVVVLKSDAKASFDATMRALRLVEQHSNTTPTIELAVALSAAAIGLSHMSGRLHGVAIELAARSQRAVEALTRKGLFFGRHLSTIMAQRNIAFVLFLRGNLRDAFSVALDAVNVCRQLRDGLKTEPLVLALAGLCCLHSGSFQVGSELMATPLQPTSKAVPPQVTTLFLSRATIAAHVGDVKALHSLLCELKPRLQADDAAPTSLVWYQVLVLHCRLLEWQFAAVSDDAAAAVAAAAAAAAGPLLRQSPLRSSASHNELFGDDDRDDDDDDRSDEGGYNDSADGSRDDDDHDDDDDDDDEDAVATRETTLSLMLPGPANSPSIPPEAAQKMLLAGVSVADLLVLLHGLPCVCSGFYPHATQILPLVTRLACTLLESLAADSPMRAEVLHFTQQSCDALGNVASSVPLLVAPWNLWQGAFECHRSGGRKQAVKHWMAGIAAADSHEQRYIKALLMSYLARYPTIANQAELHARAANKLFDDLGVSATHMAVAGRLPPPPMGWFN